MGVKNADLTDLISSTLEDLPDQYFDVTWDHAEYEFCRIYGKERMEVDGGEAISRRVMFDPTGNAKYRRAYDTDTPTVGQVLHTITVPWCRLSTDYSWDDLELLRNRNDSKGFIKLLRTRRVDGLWDLANLIEERGWKTPTSATDDLYPYGVPYYLTFFTDESGAVNTGSGFVGKAVGFQDGTYSFTAAGINANTEAKWRNYAALYTNVDNSFLDILRTALLLTKFKAPLFIDDPAQKRSGAKRIYCESTVAVDLMSLADSQDDNHGPKDLAGSNLIDNQGTVFFNRLPIVYITQLNGADYSPVYCVDFTKFIPYVHDGYWMNESEPMKDRGQHTTYTVFLDGAHNNLCTNRRTAGFVLHKANV